MSVENDYLKCVKKLEECVHEIKDITHRLNGLINLDVKSAIFDIESGVEKLEHELEADVERRENGN